jgi:hypothetical protein
LTPSALSWSQIDFLLRRPHKAENLHAARFRVLIRYAFAS